MKSACRVYSRFVSVGCVIFTVISILAVMRPAHAQVDVPFADSFESYTNNAILSGSNGWMSGVDTAAVVVVESYDYPLRKPLESEAHTQIVQLSDAVTNFLNHAGSDTNIWVDIMVLPRRSSAAPEVDNDLQMALYFNEDGNLVVRHAYYDESYFLYRTWSVLSHPPQPTDQWARVTINLNYMPGDYLYEGNVDPGTSDRFFQVMLNGGEPLEHPRGYQYVPFDSAEDQPTNGNWFMMVNSDGGIQQASNLGPTNINSVTLEGTGYFDDYVVTNADVFAATPTRWLVSATSTEGGTIYPGGNLLIPDGDDVTFSIIQTGETNVVDVFVNGVSVGPTNSVTLFNVTSNQTVHANFIPSGPLYTSKGVLHDWLDTYGLTDYETDQDSDLDEDGAKAWEEYVAGTDPTDSNSVFRVLSVMYGSNSNKVTWFGTEDSGVTTPFSMLRTTTLSGNMQDPGLWDMVMTNGVPRDPSGTNFWWDVNPPSSGTAIYRPTILWEVE